MNSSLHPDDPKPTVKQLNECENLCSKTDLDRLHVKREETHSPKTTMTILDLMKLSHV